MRSQSPVRVPGKRKLQRFAQTGLPLVMFVLCASMVAYFWRANTYGAGTIGELLPIRGDVTPEITGTLQPLDGGVALEEFMDVQEGQTIARVLRLDQALIDGRIKVLKAEAENLRSQLDSERAAAAFEDAKIALQTMLDKAQITAAVARDLAGVTVDYMKTKTLYDAARAEYQGNEKRYQMLLPYADVEDDGAGNPVPKKKTEASEENTVRRVQVPAPEMALVIRDKRMAEATMKGYAITLKRIEEQRGRLQTIMKAMQPRVDRLTAKERADLDQIMGEAPPVPTTDIEKIILPIQREMEAKLAEVDEYEAQKKVVEIKAPFSGIITNVYVRPGQAVQPGTIICTVAARESKYVLAYVRQQSNLRPVVGMRADVRFRGRAETVEGAVVKVGAQVEAVSLKQLVDPNTQEWGLPVAIKLNWKGTQEQTVGPRPGEIVYVQIRPGDSTTQQGLNSPGEVVQLGGGKGISVATH